MMTRAMIMKSAWEKYRTVVRIQHLSHREKLSAAMKMAWECAKFAAKCIGKKFTVNAQSETVEQVEKAVEVKKTVDAYVIPEWLMHEKELFYMGRSNVVRFDKVERETAKAFRMYGEWFPKSQCEVKAVEI